MAPAPSPSADEGPSLIWFGYFAPMRRVVWLPLLALVAISDADRLITIPTARKLPFKTIRYELRFQPDSFGTRESLLGIGIGPAFETELRSLQIPSMGSTNTFDFAYNYIAAFPGVSPGISVGVQDAADQTREGRRFYGVTTYRVPCTTANGDYPADVSLGMYAGRHWSPFVGVLIPFSQEIHLLAEDNGSVIAAGFEYRPTPSLNLRFQVRDNRPLMGFQWMTHF
jgi:hypothetical protein